ncbi:MAG: diguanylate phosphodiesterase [Desulfuromonas sp.]|nr:MAG: diguanylate phosphodiesterase [Desulfuromonas sp.]
MAKVLLVDDVELFLELEKSYLDGCGYDLVTASSGEETLMRIDELAPDLVVLDYYMPEMDGAEVCRTLKDSERWRDLPIIMVTAAGQMEEIDQCRSAGCDACLTKPIDQQQLREEIAQLLRRAEGSSAVDEASSESQRAGESGQASAALQALEAECARLREENQTITQRVSELEKENLDFAGQFVQVEEVNNNLTNLYIASSRLHSTLNREEALAIMKEVVINFVGAEKFAILVHEEANGLLRYETGEGFDDDVDFPEIPFGEGILGRTALNREDYFTEDSILEGSDDLEQPLVAIPLVIHDEVLGVLAIYRLFVQKEQLDPIDYQLFSMLGEHAATALFSSALYSKSERKRQTYQGFMDLLLNQ